MACANPFASAAGVAIPASHFIQPTSKATKGPKASRV